MDIKYLSLNSISRFWENIKNKFATKSDIDATIKEKISFTSNLNTGTKVGTINISDDNYDLYAPISHEPVVDNVFVQTLIPVDNTIYVWSSMTGNLTINASDYTVCERFGAHIVLTVGTTERTLTLNCIAASGDVATSLPANTQWEISILQGRIIMTQTV